MIRALSLLVALGAAPGAAALDLPSNAQMTAERITEGDRYHAPVGPFDGDAIAVQALDGRVVRRAWRIRGMNLSPLQVLRPLRAQYEANGYETVLDCADDQCGGFDFRFGTEVLPAPAMFVNLQNYHVMTMRKGPAEQPESVVSLLASAGSNGARLQIIEAHAMDDAEPTSLVTEDPVPPQGREAETDASDAPSDGLAASGFLVLDGLDFGSGDTALGAGRFESLERLAEFMTRNPEVRVALVGHTDTVGSLESNIAVSRARARSVRQRLIDAYGIDPARLDAEGMGYLAPRASNVTPEGREANRRVEAVVLWPD